MSNMPGKQAVKQLVVTSVLSDSGIEVADKNLHASRRTDSDISYNQLPISRLSVDILSIIFQLDADNSRPDYARSRVRGCRMRLSHIYRLWRFAILDMPILWAEDVLDFGVSQPAFGIILSRAQEAPLNLQCGSMDQKVLTSSLLLISRAKEMDISLPSPEIAQTMLSFLSGLSLSLLQNLSIGSSFEAPEPAQQDTASLIGAVNLRHLAMRGTYLHSPVNGCLVSLIVSHSSGRHLPRPSLYDMLHILSQNPELVTLELADAFYAYGTATFPSQIVLTKLQTLRVLVKEAMLILHDFFNLLLTPKLQKFELVGYIDEVASREHIQVPALLECTLSALTGSPALSHPEIALDVVQSDVWMNVSIGSCSASQSSYEFYLYSDDDIASYSDAIMKCLSNAHILGYVRKLQFDDYDLSSRATEHWNASMFLCTRAEKLEMTVAVKDAVTVLGLLVHYLEATPPMPLLRRISFHSPWKGIEEDELETMKELASKRCLVLDTMESICSEAQ